MAENKSFLGSGWSFPPRFMESTDGLEMSHDENDIAESIMVLLTTTPGERVMNPKYGCDLQSMVFSSMSATNKTRIQDMISTAILYFEPRVKIASIQIDSTDRLKGRLDISITYDIKGTNSRKNLVYPFYLSEGTDV
ncbi:MAG: GPW/gp25 family protein [Saprospiraceae bacterium]|nr:GPW/gp25 family protein [Saprospiraceae bacterium]